MEEQEGYLHNLDLSAHSQDPDVTPKVKRVSAADKTYWTRVFHPDDPPILVPEPSTGKPGIYCINDDIE